jgi:hypothetical protein
MEAELNSDSRYVAVVLSEPPNPKEATGRYEVVAALRAGVPVIIWHREDCSTSAFREMVSELFDRGPADLPLRVTELRKQIATMEPKARERHAGRHLTLLWDEPGRTPTSMGTSGTSRWGDG